MNWKFLTIPGALAAALAVRPVLGLPHLATGSDIKRLDRNQAETAITVYSNKIRGLLAVSPSQDKPTAYRAWQEDLNQAREQLKRAEDRKIELTK